ncbi:MAG: ATP-binding cassette domain-containing protein [Kiritimatiellia bacterium]
MLDVVQVTRCFGYRVALEQVTFQAARGDIVGILGPNGAGKTTLLRMAACYLQPTRGVIRLNGLDSFRQSLEYRGHMGYLPERCPLYDDMTVGEYLLYRARLKGLSFRRASRCARELAGQLGLGELRGRLIGKLSLGCRRRTALADALLHDPRLLLLDDPIANVDPLECEQITAGVTRAARHAVVLVSGHALSQLGALCTRFLVFRAGHLVADMTRTELQASDSGVRLVAEVSGATESALKRIAALFPGGGEAIVQLQPDGWWQVSWGTAQASGVRDAVVTEIARQGWRLRSVSVAVPSMEARLADLVAGRAGMTATTVAREGA